MVDPAVRRQALTTGNSPGDARQWLAGAEISPAVFRLRPDYAALLIVADDLRPGPTDEASDGLLAAAETRAREMLDGRAPEDIDEICEWREAYRAFGAKPQCTRPNHARERRPARNSGN